MSKIEYTFIEEIYYIIMTLRSQDLDFFLITDYNYSVKDMFVLWVFKATYYFSFITNSLCLYQLTLPFTKKSHIVCALEFLIMQQVVLYIQV
jgi:hypothetical protein